MRGTVLEFVWRHWGKPRQVNRLPERNSNPETQDNVKGISDSSNVTFGLSLSKRRGMEGKDTSKLSGATACCFFRIFLHSLLGYNFLLAWVESTPPLQRLVDGSTSKNYLRPLKTSQFYPRGCSEPFWRSQKLRTYSSKFIMRFRFEQIALHRMFAERVGDRLVTTYQLSNLSHTSQDDRSRLQCVGWIIIDTRQRY